MSGYLLFTKQRGICALVFGHPEALEVGKYKSPRFSVLGRMKDWQRELIDVVFEFLQSATSRPGIFHQ